MDLTHSGGSLSGMFRTITILSLLIYLTISDLEALIYRLALDRPWESAQQRRSGEKFLTKHPLTAVHC